MRKSLANMSSGETAIYRLLQENKIKFERESTFADCRRRRPLPFDFKLKNAFGFPIVLVEFDGQQHFYPVWGGETAHGTVKYNDSVKNRYCLKENIPLIRIPYWEKDNLTLEMLNPKTSLFLVEQVNHNSPYYITHQKYVTQPKRRRKRK